MTRWRFSRVSNPEGALRRSSPTPRLAIAFAQESGHRSTKRYRGSAVSADAIAGQAGIHHRAVEADAVAAITVDVIAVKRDLPRNLLAPLHLPVPVPVTPAVADAAAADGVGPRGAVEAYAVLAVSVDHAASQEPASPRHAGRAAARDIEA